MRSLVTPGVYYIIEIFLPTILLNKVDLPTFGLPTKATVGNDIVSLPNSALIIAYICKLSKKICFIYSN